MINTHTTLVLIAHHAAFAGAGFADGVYALPIFIAPAAHTTAEPKAATAQVQFTGQLRRDRQGSDALLWGEGVLSVARNAISLAGEISRRPDFKLYLSPEFVEIKADFFRLKSPIVRVGDMATFHNFVVSVPVGVKPARCSAVNV